MIHTFLRENKFAAIFLTFIRVYLGYKWMTAGWGKVTGDFDTSGFLKGAIAKAGGEKPAVQGWWASFLENVALPNSDVFTFLVSWGELLVGIALLIGLFTTFAASMGALMNFAFLFSGTLSSNPNMVFLTIFLLVAGANAGRFGLDRYVKEVFTKYIQKAKE